MNFEELLELFKKQYTPLDKVQLDIYDTLLNMPSKDEIKQIETNRIIYEFIKHLIENSMEII